MPMIRFITSYPYDDNEKQRISKIVQNCMENYFDTPKNDRFHIFEDLSRGQILVDLNYWVEAARTKKFILLYITAGKERTLNQKSKLMLQVTNKLHQEFDIPKQDIMFIIVHNKIDDWCFGNAQRADIYLESSKYHIKHN